jgi:hypothetical protein
MSYKQVKKFSVVYNTNMCELRGLVDDEAAPLRLILHIKNMLVLTNFEWFLSSI